MAPETPNFDADTIDDALRYFALRSGEMAGHGWKFNAACAIGAADTGSRWGVLAVFRNGSDYRYAIYVLKSRRGSGLLTSYIAPRPSMKFITIDDCNVADFYRKRGRDVLVLGSSSRG